MQATDATNTWTYGTATWRPANNDTGNRVAYVQGVAETPITASVACGIFPPTGSSGSVGIGIDATNADSSVLRYQPPANTTSNAMADYLGYPGIGYHYIQWLEYARLNGGGNTTFIGDNGIVTQQSGLLAMVEA
jgi:hypothetical protein